jgi:hypothetical protein
MKKYSLALSSIFIASGLLALTQNFFSVRQIECVFNTNSACPPELRASLETLRGTALFFTDTQNTSTFSIDATGHTLEKIEKVLPSTLVLYFLPSEVLYQVRIDESYYSTNTEGFLQVSSENGAIPTVVFFNRDLLLSPTQLKPEVHQVLKLLVAEAQKNSISVSTIEWRSEQELVLLCDQTIAVSIDTTDIPKKMAQLEQILHSAELEEITQQNATSPTLDLRFNLPVLRTP